MPYYTKKGTSKKDKGKTCVYKKEDNTKVGCTTGPVEKYLAALHINESEENNDLDWIELTNPTLQQYFDSQALNLGDKLWLRGNTDNEDGNDQIYVDGVFTITGGVNKKYLNSVDFDTTDDIKELLGIDADQPHFLGSDGNLEVYRIKKVDQLNESEEDDLNWIKNTIPNPLELYYFKGFDDVGIIINSFEESKYIINILQSMSYEWISNTIGDNYNPFSPDEMVRDGGGIIWANKDKELQHSSLDYELDEGEIIIDNPFSSTSLSESNENNDLSWIGDIGKDIEGFIEKLSSLIKEYVPVADLELDWDQTHGGGEYFGRVWLYDTFYELYKYGKTFTVRFYQQDPENNEYYQFDSYEDLSQTHLLTILLNKMIDVNRKNLNESEEFGDFTWAQEIEADLVPGEIYDIKTGNGYYWVPELYVGKEWDEQYQVEYYKFKDMGGSSGRGRKSAPYVKELIQKGDIRPYNPNWSIKDELTFSDNLEDALKGNFVIYFKNGTYLDQTLAIQDKLFEMGFSFYTKNPNEYVTNKDSSDKIQFFESFNWDNSKPRYKSMPSDQWDKKKILLSTIKKDDFSWGSTPSPRHEEQELFITAKDHNAIIIDGDRYITDNITDNITESKDFEWLSGPVTVKFADIKNDFYDYMSVGDTIHLSGLLMLSDDLNPDPYNSMLLNMEPVVVLKGDANKIGQLNVKFNENIINQQVWLNNTNSEWLNLGSLPEDDELIITLPENKNIIESEANDFDWIKNIGSEIETFVEELINLIKEHVPVAHLELDWDTATNDGEYFGRVWLYDRFYELYKYDKFFKIVFYYLDPQTDRYEAYSQYENLPKNKLLRLLLNDMIAVSRRNRNLYEGEGHDFDWVKQQEPEKELNKNKSYVVDVTDLRPTPIKHSHDTSLTRQDILRRFGELGYDVDGIDVEEARYFYIEPNKGIGWDYNEYGVPIEYDYWIDYNKHYMEDPSYGGKYQSIDIDELMFLLDNNLISESDEDMSWLTTSVGEPMTICDAELELNVGDNILISELPDWENVSTDGSRGKIHKNINATVLAVDDCNKIQPDNATTKKTILIYVNNDYDGFNSDWVDSFADEEHKQICSDGRCMFMICGDKYLSQNIKITKLNNSFLWESEENDLGWMSTTIPTRKDKIDFNKERFETTLDYGNDVNVGDRFIPPGGNIVWTVERKQISNRGNSYSVALKNEKNKLKFYNWNPDYGFPSYYRPWKKIIGPKESITESAGISFESRVWTDIIYDEIMSKPEEKTRIIIDGYNYPEAFDKFPIDYVVIDYYDRITGYGQDYSGYDNDGNYIVHLYIQPKLVRGQGGYSLKSTLNHEMRHAWEDYNRRSKGLPSIDDTKEAKELYNKDFIHLMSDDKVVGPIKDVLKYFYYLSKLETGPYMENVYDQNPTYESLVREIATKDFENFKERFDLELNWHLINTNYNIPFTKKFKSATDFIDYSAKELRKRAHKVIKKINKVKYVHGKMN